MGASRRVVAVACGLVGAAVACGAARDAPRTLAAPSATAPRPVRAREAPVASASSVVPAVDPATLTLGPWRHPMPATLLMARQHPMEGCDVEALRASFGRACRRVVPTRVQVTGGQDPRALVDGSACSIWNSGGFAPQGVRLDLPPSTALDAIVWIAEMTPPDGLVAHTITLGAGDEAPEVLRVRGVMSTSIPYAVMLRPRTTASSIEIATRESPSWVAWRELVLLDCGGAASLPDGAVPSSSAMPEPPAPPASPPQQVVRVPGRGACARAADCVPEGCCRTGDTCVASFLQRCVGMVCPADATPWDTGESRCVCEKARCGAEHTR